jgi:hypothetical protein
LAIDLNLTDQREYEHPYNDTLFGKGGTVENVFPLLFFFVVA